MEYEKLLKKLHFDKNFSLEDQTFYNYYLPWFDLEHTFNGLKLVTNPNCKDVFTEEDNALKLMW